MIGYTINVEDEGYNKISNEKLEQFENNIIIEGNNYENRSIDSNIFNKVGNKIENVIIRRGTNWLLRLTIWEFWDLDTFINAPPYKKKQK